MNAGARRELADEEIRALARAFRPGPSARALLRRAGFPVEHVPSEIGTTSEQFWYDIGAALAEGVMADGPRRLLAEAHRSYPAHPVFRTAATPAATPAATTTCTVPDPAAEEATGSQAATPHPAIPHSAAPHSAAPKAPTPEAAPAAAGRAAIRRVLVVGAAPTGTERLRADRELRAIQQAARAARDSFTVDYCPAALVTDLRRVLNPRPDVLHLICHGDDSHLAFEDTYGEPHRVPAAQVAALLRAYGQPSNGPDTPGGSGGPARLRGLVLASCDSEAVAALFASAAEVVIAHRGPLDDESAVVFAGELYGLLSDVPALDEAARIAAEQARAVLGGDYGAALRANLVVLAGAGG